MYCRYCGTQLAEDSIFCHRCGQKCEILQRIQAVQPEIQQFEPVVQNTVPKKKKLVVPSLDERKEYVDVVAYWLELHPMKKLAFGIVFSIFSLWSAILVLSFFI